MRILIIGRGGREHAIAWKMAQSALNPELFIAPGNVGMRHITAQTGASVTLVDIGENETERLRDFAITEHIDLTVVGPEAALANDIATVFGRRPNRDQQGVRQGFDAQVPASYSRVSHV